MEKTATITKREKQVNSFTAHNSWRGGVSYEWVTTYFNDGVQIMTSVNNTRKGARERINDLGYKEMK